MVKPCSRNKNSPLVRLQNKYERYGTENNVLSGRGLARRPLSARRVHIKMTSHVAQCIHNTSYCAARELCRLQIWTKRYREHFTVLVIWTLVYREHVPRTFCQGFVPRTYMNGLTVASLLKISTTSHMTWQIIVQQCPLSHKNFVCKFANKLWMNFHKLQTFQKKS